MTEKLQKVLARFGLGSRREMEGWIQQGRIKIGTQVATIGDRVDSSETIFIDDKPIKRTRSVVFKQRVLLYYKPEGEICTRTDPENRPTVFSHLPVLKDQRWIMIGRLDINTSGLLLFTNDGELAHRLSHPSYEVEREYAVRVLGKVETTILRQLKKGVKLEDGMAAFTRIEERGGEGANRWYHVVLKEGRNREVRRLWESQGVKVSRLIRIRFATVCLPQDLKRGKWEELTTQEIQQLVQLIDR